jgi:hypothetical protein
VIQANRKNTGLSKSTIHSICNMFTSQKTRQGK